MNTQEAARKWRTTNKTVYRYCQLKLIRAAYKETSFPFRWNIPDIEQPPASPDNLIILLTLLQSIHEGAHINFDSIGISEATAKQGYAYLSNNGFISYYSDKKSDINIELKSVQLTSLGRDIIDAAKSKAKITSCVTGSVGLNVGIFNCKLSKETTTKTV